MKVVGNGDWRSLNFIVRPLCIDKRARFGTIEDNHHNIYANQSTFVFSSKMPVHVMRVLVRSPVVYPTTSEDNHCY